jgi:hypothetical protein
MFGNTTETQWKVAIGRSRRRSRRGQNVMIATQGRSFIKLNKLSLIAVRVAISLVLHPTHGHALGTESERAACTPDVFRLCSSEIPNIDRIIACMNAKRASLSTHAG